MMLQGKKGFECSFMVFQVVLLQLMVFVPLLGVRHGLDERKPLHLQFLVQAFLCGARFACVAELDHLQYLLFAGFL